MRIIISGRLFDASKNRISLGILTARVKVEKYSQPLWDRIDASIKKIAEELKGVKDVPARVPQVQAVCDTYKALGKNPKQFKGSNEALLLRAIQGKGLYKINTVVDINNLISLEARRSLGSYDLGKLRGNIEFRAGTEGELYAGTTKRSVDLAKLPLLADSVGAFGSPTSDSDRALISETTTSLMTVIFSFDGDEKLNEQLNELEQLFVQYAEAKDIGKHIVNHQNRELTLDLSALGYDDSPHIVSGASVFTERKEPKEEKEVKMNEENTAAPAPSSPTSPSFSQ